MWIHRDLYYTTGHNIDSQNAIWIYKMQNGLIACNVNSKDATWI